jgi:predicted membrane chloride channel (bestrophin family)
MGVTIPAKSLPSAPSTPASTVARPPIQAGGILALIDAVAPVVSLSVAVACVACTMLESGKAVDPAVAQAFAAVEKLFPLCTTCVTFSLGFFVSTSYSRWWKLRDLSGSVLGRTIDTMVMICTYLNGVSEKACYGRRTLARYLLLAHAISLQAGHQAYRFDKLVELGLLDDDSGELRALRQANTARYNIVRCCAHAPWPRERAPSGRRADVCA